MNIFGISENLDIYYASNTINAIIIAIFGSSINYSTTPLLLKLLKKNNINGFRLLSNSLINIFFIFFFILAILQFTFSSQIASVLFPGFLPSNQILLSDLFSIQAFISILSALIGIINAINFSLNKIYRTIVFSVLGSLIQIIYIYFAYESQGIFSLVYALALMQFVTLVGQSLSLIKYYQMKINFNSILKESLNKMSPLAISSIFGRSDILIDRYLSSMLLAGSITLLHYGNLFIMILTSLVNKGISIVSLRKFSYLTDDRENFNVYFVKIFKIMLSISLFFVLNIFIAGELILDTFFKTTTSLNQDQISKIYLIVLFLQGSFIGGVISSVLVNAFYSKGLTSLIAKFSVMINSIGIMSKYYFFNSFGFYALPVVFSVKSILNAAFLLLLYNIYIDKVRFSKVGLITIKIFSIAFLCLQISFFLENYLFNDILNSIMTSVLYIVLIYFFILRK